MTHQHVRTTAKNHDHRDPIDHSPEWQRFKEADALARKLMTLAGDPAFDAHASSYAVPDRLFRLRRSYDRALQRYARRAFTLAALPMAEYRDIHTL